MKVFLKIVTTALFLCPAFAQAETPAPKCAALEDMMLYLGVGMPKEHPINQITLGLDDVARFIFYVSYPDKTAANNKDTLFMPWRLLERSSDDKETFCLIAGGDRLEALMSMPDTKVGIEYGMPGSGKPRCTDSALDAATMQWGANKELGDSEVFYLHNEIGPNNYTYMKARDGHWIMLSDDRKRDLQCYHSRGDYAIVRTVRIKRGGPIP